MAVKKVRRGTEPDSESHQFPDNASVYRMYTHVMYHLREESSPYTLKNTTRIGKRTNNLNTISQALQTRKKPNRSFPRNLQTPETA